MDNRPSAKRIRKAQAFRDNLAYLAAMTEHLHLLACYRCRAYRILPQAFRQKKKTTLPSITPRQVHASLKRLERRVLATLAEGRVTLPLEELAARHGLADIEKLVLAALIAASTDDRFCIAMEELSGRCGIREVSSMLALLCDDVAAKIAARRCFVGNSALFANGLLSIGYGNSLMSESDFMRMELEIPRRVASYILGEYDINDAILAFSALIEPEVCMDQMVLPDHIKTEVLNLVRDRDEYLRCRKEWGFDRVIGYGRGVTLLFSGPPGTGKTMLAHALAKSAGARLMLVDIRKIVGYSKRDFEVNLAQIFHEARLQNAFLFFDEADELFCDRSVNNVMPLLLRELERIDGICILATNRRQVLDEALDRRVLYKLEFEIPGAEQRTAIWRNLLPPQAPVAADIDLVKLGETFEFSGGYIKNAVQNAMISALWRPAHERVITQLDLWAAALKQRSNRLAASADKIVPKVTLADVVLDTATRAQVAALVQAARHRHTVFRQWGFGNKSSCGKGVAALLSGASGTGKTLTAEAVAGELGYNLYPVRTESVVSKYIGETEKNLAAVFDAVAGGDAVLFFDEADALFGRRSRDADSTAHGCNQQINLLLTRLERFDGIVLLATNRTEDMDKAFERRLRFHIRFAPPDIQQRAALWRGLLPPETPRADDLDLDLLAREFEFTGGTIKSVLLRAAFDSAACGARLSQGALLKAASFEKPFVPPRKAVGF